MRDAFRRANADEVALRMDKSGVSFLSKKQFSLPASGEMLPQEVLVQAVEDANTGLSEHIKVRKWKHPDTERKEQRFFGIAYFWRGSI